MRLAPSGPIISPRTVSRPTCVTYITNSGIRGTTVLSCASPASRCYSTETQVLLETPCQGPFRISSHSYTAVCSKQAGSSQRRQAT